MNEKNVVIVPIKVEEFVVGIAEISLDGKVLIAKFNSGMIGKELREVLAYGFADSISIWPNIIPAQERKQKHHHNPIQHRDGKPPWCKVCGLTADLKIPEFRFKMPKLRKR